MGESFKLALAHRAVSLSSPAALPRQVGSHLGGSHLSSTGISPNGGHAGRDMEMGWNVWLTAEWSSIPVHGDCTLPLQHKYNVIMRHTERDTHTYWCTDTVTIRTWSHTNKYCTHKVIHRQTNTHTGTYTHSPYSPVYGQRDLVIFSVMGLEVSILFYIFSVTLGRIISIGAWCSHPVNTSQRTMQYNTTLHIIWYLPSLCLFFLCLL